MASSSKKSKNKTKEDSESKELQLRVQYPIALLFQVSILAGTIIFLVTITDDPSKYLAALYRAFVTFLGFAIGGGILMVICISILHDITMQEYKNEELRLKEEHERLVFEREQELLRLYEKQQAALDIQLLQQAQSDSDTAFDR